MLKEIQITFVIQEDAGNEYGDYAQFITNTPYNDDYKVRVTMINKTGRVHIYPSCTQLGFKE